MRFLNIEQAMHIENDVVIYIDPQSLAEKLHKRFKGKVTVTPMGPREGCTAAVLYADSLAAISKLTDHFLDLLRLGEKAIRSKIRYSQMVHEMLLLGIILNEHPDLVGTFPILPAESAAMPMAPRRSKPIFRPIVRLLDLLIPQTMPLPRSYSLFQDVDTFGCVFDPASYGQFLGGMPKPHKSGPGVILRDHWIAPDLKAETYEIEWGTEGDGIRRPWLRDARTGRRCPLFNLHIHCKKISDYV